MFSMLKMLTGWTALVLIAVLGVVAMMLPMPVVRKALWVVIAIVAVHAAWREFGA